MKVSVIMEYSYRTRVIHMQQVEELMLTQEHNKALVDHPVQIELVVYRMHSPQDVPILPVS